MLNLDLTAKKTIRLSRVWCFVVAIFAWGGVAFAQTRSFSFAYDQPRASAYGVAADIFEKKLKEVSGQKLGINHFPSAQLGSESQMLQKMRAGDIDFMLSASAQAATVAPQAGVFGLHYLFRDQNHLMRTLANPAVSVAYRDMIKDSVQHAQVLSLFTLGFRHIYGKKSVASVGDLKGQSVRVQPNKTEDEHFAAYGAQTVRMPFSDVYTSLQTGVMNFAENGLNIYLINKHYEVAPVMSLTEHEANINCLWVSSKAWGSLSPQEQKWVQLAADEVARTQPAIALRMEQEAGAKLKAMGVKVVEGVDKAGFANVARPIQDRLAEELGPHAVKLLKLVRDMK